jgi:hypothetical protein
MKRKRPEDGSMFDEEEDETWSLFKDQDRKEEYKKVKKDDLF